MGKKHKKPAGPLVKRIVVAVVLAATAAGLAYVFYRTLWPPSSAHRPREGPTVHVGADTRTVALFYSSDLQGRLLGVRCEEGSKPGSEAPPDPVGGVARMAAVYRTWSKERPDHIIVDVGNATVGEHKQADAINGLMMKALDGMGCAVVNCGDNEAALSLDRLTDLAKGRTLQMISASLVSAKDNRPVFPPHTVVPVGNLRVGFIGLLGQDIAPRQLGKGLRLLHPAEALANSLSALQDKADLIVVLAYLPPEEIYKLARKHSPKVNLFLGGRAQASSAPYEFFGRTLIAYLGDEGCTVGRIEDPSFPKERSPWAVGRIALLDKLVQDDASLGPILAELAAALGREKPPGADWDPKMPCTSKYVGADVCKLCHIKEYYSWHATSHAGAYGTLLKLEEKEEEKAKGKGEARKFSKMAECLICHTTGFGMPGGYDPQKTAKPSAEGRLEDGAGLKKLPQGQYSLTNVGCEACHGGARRHLGVAISAKFDVPKAPQLRIREAARTCRRCHNGDRPCLEAGKVDLFEEDEYLKKIKHWN